MPACHAGDRRFDPGRDRNFEDEHSDPAVFIFFYLKFDRLNEKQYILIYFNYFAKLCKDLIEVT